MLVWDRVCERLDEVARRAGVTGVPAPVIASAMALCVAACAWGVWRFWPRDIDDAGGNAGRLTIERGGSYGIDATGSGVDVRAVGPAGAETSAPANVVVHVAGAVRHPDVYELPLGSRVADAVAKAGGALPDACVEAVNLARILADGEQILIPDEDTLASGAARGAAVAGGVTAAAQTSGGLGGAGTGAPIDLNTADVTALDTLPGIGPATAAKIVADREANGPFASVQDLTRVSGIGEKKVAQLEGFACVR